MSTRQSRRVWVSVSGSNTPVTQAAEAAPPSPDRPKKVSLAHRGRKAWAAHTSMDASPPQHTTGLRKAAKRVVTPLTELSM